MGGKSSPPPAPDYGPIAEASKEAARYSYALGREQLDWAREQYGMDRELSDSIISQFLYAQDANMESAAADRARYQDTYQPMEDALVADAREFSSPGRQELERGKAAAAVAQQFEGARQAAQQRLTDFGVDPTSLKFAALDRGYAAQSAAAQAAAANQAGAQSEAVGRALRSEAINVGRGYPGQIAGQYGTSLNAGTGAVNANLATTASGANTMGTPVQWQGMGNQSLGIWGDALTKQHNAAMDVWKAEQSQSSGGMGLAGTALGIAGSLMKFEDGGAVPMDDSIGGAVPTSASPTGGTAIDDVPARLNAGEFVIPKDVVAWHGEKFMHQLIEKTRKEQQELPQRSGAIPDVGMAEPAAPTFQSGAIG